MTAFANHFGFEFRTGIRNRSLLLLNYPILSLFDRPLSLFGLPLLHVYLFVVWLALIVGAAWIVERGAR